MKMPAIDEKDRTAETLIVDHKTKDKFKKSKNPVNVF
jgi:hypothetical protein